MSNLIPLYDHMLRELQSEGYTAHGRFLIIYTELCLFLIRDTVHDLDDTQTHSVDQVSLTSLLIREVTEVLEGHLRHVLQFVLVR